MSEWDIYSGVHDAATNLAIDEYLLEETSDKRNKVFRIYDFEKPSVILARMESYKDINGVKEGVDYSRRDTGGSVIYCDNNAMFYSIILPTGKNRFPEELHRNYFGPKIARVLDRAGVEKEKLGIGEHFSVRINGKTVSGNSQRKKKDAVLYHGVLALEPWDVEKLDSLIKLREKEGELEKDFIEELPGIKEHCDTSYNELKKIFVEEVTEGDYSNRRIGKEQYEEIERLVNNKYGNEDWIRTGGNEEALKEDRGFCFVDWTDEWNEDVEKYGFY